MGGIRKLTAICLAAILWIAVVFLAGGPAGAQSAANNRSLYAKQGQFAARTTNYVPAWKVHPKVRPPRVAARDPRVEQARYQAEPPFGNDEQPAQPSFDSGIPTEEEPVEEAPPVIRTPPPAARQIEEPARQAPVEQAPAQRAPRQNGGQRPTLAPPPPEEVMAPRERAYEELPTPRATPRRAAPRVQPEFQYGMTEEYGAQPPEEFGEFVEGEYDEYGGEYGGEYQDGYGAPCPNCGGYGDYCQCPPNVCDDTWPCWHARKQWRNFRLFGGGWDIGCPWNWWDEFSLFAGPHSFKGPLDQGQNGNFGIQEGLNWGGPLWHCKGIGFQLGAQGVQSNFSGYNVNGVNDDNRNQVFATAGIFARAPNNHGWQVGVAFDWLQDNYYVDVSLDQIRAELSYVTFCGTELGAWIASSSKTDTDENTGVKYGPTDMYALFLRHCVPTGGEGRIWGGGTGDGNGMIGADFRVPLTNRWALAGVVNYVIPQDGANAEGLNQEAWGITMNLVWHPFRPRCGNGNNGLYRPLLNVADNTMFMVDRDTGN